MELAIGAFIVSTKVPNLVGSQRAEKRSNFPRPAIHYGGCIPGIPQEIVSHLCRPRSAVYEQGLSRLSTVKGARESPLQLRSTEDETTVTTPSEQVGD